MDDVNLIWTYKKLVLLRAECSVVTITLHHICADPSLLSAIMSNVKPLTQSARNIYKILLTVYSNDTTKFKSWVDASTLLCSKFKANTSVNVLPLIFVTQIDVLTFHVTSILPSFIQLN